MLEGLTSNNLLGVQADRVPGPFVRTSKLSLFTGLFSRSLGLQGDSCSYSYSYSHSYSGDYEDISVTPQHPLH